uniref:Uncharacterized protein n=1 Tax=Timema tahoe TaxID=61484 RepID=A0A7R9IJK6_9NEOP|nr:unnamed protein product [Timema tahoe]
MASQDETDHLCDWFDEVFEMYSDIDNGETRVADNMLILVQNILWQFEDIVRTVSRLGLFDVQVPLEQVPTQTLKLFLLPALMGTLCVKLSGEDRTKVVQLTEIYFRDFLERCRRYCIADVSVPTQGKVTATRGPAANIEGVLERYDVILRCSEERSRMERRLQNLRAKMAASESAKREYYLTLIQSFVGKVLDLLEKLEMETPLVQSLCKGRKGISLSEKETRQKMAMILPAPRPLQPVLILKYEPEKQQSEGVSPDQPSSTELQRSVIELPLLEESRDEVTLKGREIQTQKALGGKKGARRKDHATRSAEKSRSKTRK